MNQARAERLRQTDEKTSYELPAGTIACAAARHTCKRLKKIAIKVGPDEQAEKAEGARPPRIVSDSGIWMPKPIGQGLMKLSTVLTRTPRRSWSRPQAAPLQPP